MEKTYKKSFSSIIIHLLILLIDIFILGVNIYGYITYKYSYLIYILVLLLLILLISLVLIFSCLFYPLYPLKIYDKFIIIKRFKEMKISLDEIETTSTNQAKYSFFNSYKLEIFLKNGKIITLRYLNKALDAHLTLQNSLKDPLLLERENKLLKFFRLIFNSVVYLVIKIMKKRKPILLDDLDQLLEEYKVRKLNNVFVLLDPVVKEKTDIIELLNNSSLKVNLKLNILTPSTPLHNPKEETINLLVNSYLENDCDSILSIGGGSTIDASKALGVKLAKLSRPLYKAKGYFRVKGKVPFLSVIPTLFGSGSETTSACVINFENTKCAIYSPKITPKYCLYIPSLLKGVSVNLSLKQSFDILSHALESYFSYFKYEMLDILSFEAVDLVFKAFDEIDENEDKAKEDLFLASFKAGQAFNFKFVGNVHSLSHALSYKYNLDHAKTNGIIMPYVFKSYIYSSYFRKRLLKLSKTLKWVKVDENNSQNCLNILLEKLNLIREKISQEKGIKEIKREDLKELATLSFKESHLFYPTPIRYSKRQHMMMLINVKEEEQNGTKQD